MAKPIKTRHVELPKAFLGAVRLDPTLINLVAAEACLSSRSIYRAVKGEVVRDTTIVSISRAWERVQARKELAPKA